jgi:colicin import membrane protein
MRIFISAIILGALLAPSAMSQRGEQREREHQRERIRERSASPGRGEPLTEAERAAIRERIRSSLENRRASGEAQEERLKEIRNRLRLRIEELRNGKSRTATEKPRGEVAPKHKKIVRGKPDEKKLKAAREKAKREKAERAKKAERERKEREEKERQAEGTRRMTKKQFEHRRQIQQRTLRGGRGR